MDDIPVATNDELPTFVADFLQVGAEELEKFVFPGLLGGVIWIYLRG